MTVTLHTTNHIFIAAPADVVFALAADVARWPDLLAHYRYVEADASPVAKNGIPSRLVRMGAAHRHIPVRWTALQVVDRAGARVLYRHVAGITRGMVVEWRIEDGVSGCNVFILHDLVAPKGLLRLPWARVIAGRQFITPIADRTLAGIKWHAERSSGGAGQS